MSGEEKSPREEAREMVKIVATGPSRNMSDVEELEKVLSALSRFLRDLQEPLEKLLKSFLDIVSGDKVGGDVAAFYRNLKEAGMPEELIVEMTKQYFERRIAVLDIVKAIAKEISGGDEEEEEEEEE